MKQISDKEMALCIYSDVFKEANGFRPRGSLVPSHLTVEEIEAKIEALSYEINAEAAVTSGAADWMDERDRPSMFDDFYGIDLGEDGDGWR